MHVASQNCPPTLRPVQPWLSVENVRHILDINIAKVQNAARAATDVKTINLDRMPFRRACTNPKPINKHVKSVFKRNRRPVASKQKNVHNAATDESTPERNSRMLYQSGRS